LLESTNSDHELVTRCQRGDMQAYQALFHRFEQPMLRLGLRMLGQQQDAEDAVQTTFLRLHKSIHGFAFRSTIGTYLFRIMMNTCLDMLKKRKQLLVPDQTAEPSYTPQETLRLKLEQQITKLPDRMRACFVMFAVEGFKQQEIADVLSLSIGTVKAHIHEAKQRLRAALFQSEQP